MKKDGHKWPPSPYCANYFAGAGGGSNGSLGFRTVEPGGMLTSSHFSFTRTFPARQLYAAESIWHTPLVSIEPAGHTVVPDVYVGEV